MPVRIFAREGPQIELAQKEFSKSMPSVAIRSIFGVGAILSKRPPGYAEIALQAWSSENMKTMLGLLADATYGSRHSPMERRERSLLFMTASSRADLGSLDKRGRLSAGGRHIEFYHFTGCVVTGET